MIHVVAAAVTDAHGRVLIAQRPAGKHLAGGWEFPGGKLEPGESRAGGLARELREELGIEAHDPRPLVRVRHTYPYGDVLIDMWVVERYDGEPRGMDGQALRWLSLEALEDTELLPADRPIVRALRLPARLTERRNAHYAVEAASPRHTAAAVGETRSDRAPMLRGLECDGERRARERAAHADFLVMRCELAPAELRALCAAVPVPVFARAIELETAWSHGASGVNMLTDHD